MEIFADKVKNIVVNPNGGEYSDKSISKYFEHVKFGDIHTPAVIMDCHGNIMAWHLVNGTGYPRVFLGVPIPVPVIF